MADTLQFDLVSPERKVASGAASMVVAPGVEGDIGALPGHAPFVTTLRPGALTASIDGTEHRFIVLGGFVEIGPDRCTVLAEDVAPASEFDAGSLGARIKAAEESLAAAQGADTARRSQYLLDLQALQAALS